MAKSKYSFEKRQKELLKKKKKEEKRQKKISKNSEETQVEKTPEAGSEDMPADNVE